MNPKTLPLVLATALAACASEPAQGDGAGSTSAEDDTASLWVTVIEQDQDTRTDTPAGFRIRGDEVRIIATAGPSTSEFRPGVLVANVLTAESTLPLAGVRIERSPRDTVRADTTRVRVPAGELLLFVPIRNHMGDWSVEVQQRRGPESPSPSSP